MLPSRVCLQCRLRLTSASRLVRPTPRAVSRIPSLQRSYSDRAEDLEDTYSKLLDAPVSLFRSHHQTRKPPKPEKSPSAKLEKSSPLIQTAHSKFSYPSPTHRVSDLRDQYSGQYNLDKEVTDEEEVIVAGYLAWGKSWQKTTYSAYIFDSDQHHEAETYEGNYAFKRGFRVVWQADPEMTDEENRTFGKLISHSHPFAPVVIKGIINKPKGEKPEIVVSQVWHVNDVKKGLIWKPETVWTPTARHLQLRCENKLWLNLRTRHKVAQACRKALDKNGFLEVETPLLFKSTPEGAREFLVPTRITEKKEPLFYALPQSPQQYKQMLMASGVMKYYQIAKCFRDEDLRADRQPEFTQLDLEMAWAKQEDVMQLMESVVKAVWKEVHYTDLKSFERMTWQAAMSKYGSDKPDQRFGQISHVFYRGGTEDVESFAMFPNSKDPDSAEKAEKVLAAFKEQAPAIREDVIAYIANEKSAYGLPEYGLTASDIDEIHERIRVVPDAVVFLTKRDGKPFVGGSTLTGQLRTLLINLSIEHEFIDPKILSNIRFLWVTDFPLFSPASTVGAGEGQGGDLVSTHHPFTAPHEDDFHLLETNPIAVRGQHYDLVLNGVELGGGSRRIHDPTLQRYIFENILKMSTEKMKSFEHLLDVLSSGAPPHAGMALGFDRLVAMCCNTTSIRDVIAFPKNQSGKDPMVSSPGKVTEEQITTYNLIKRGRRLPPLPPSNELGNGARDHRKVVDALEKLDNELEYPKWKKTEANRDRGGKEVPDGAPRIVKFISKDDEGFRGRMLAKEELRERAAERRAQRGWKEKKVLRERERVMVEEVEVEEVEEGEEGRVKVRRMISKNPYDPVEEGEKEEK